MELPTNRIIKAVAQRPGNYTNFIFKELLPHIHETYNVPSFKEKSFAGFSLGGLSALDIVWNHADEFANVGVFSGSLWWRSKGYKEGYDDNKHRIMHQQIKKGKFYPWLKFFFECGALDEKADRNNNGVIDAIDDTLDLIKELTEKRLQWKKVSDILDWKRVSMMYRPGQEPFLIF